MEKLMTIASSVCFGTGAFPDKLNGVAIATPDTLYIVVGVTPNYKPGLLLLFWGPLLGGIATTGFKLSVQRKLESLPSGVVTSASEVADDIRKSAEWPSKAKEDTTVLAIVKPAIKSIKFDIIGNLILTIDDIRICLGVGIFRKKKVQEFLVNYDWLSSSDR